MTYTTGRPARGTVSEPVPVEDSIVSASATFNESESESRASDTVSAVAPAADTVSAAASVRIDTGFETSPPPRATSRPVPPVWATTVRPVELSSTAIVVSGEKQNTAGAAESPRPRRTPRGPRRGGGGGVWRASRAGGGGGGASLCGGGGGRVGY